jgi:hypothetical protein
MEYLLNLIDVVAKVSPIVLLALVAVVLLLAFRAHIMQLPEPGKYAFDPKLARVLRPQENGGETIQVRVGDSLRVSEKVELRVVSIEDSLRVRIEEVPTADIATPSEKALEYLGNVTLKPKEKRSVSGQS